MRRYGWIRRVLLDWAKHWWETVDSLESTNQIYRWMTEGINPPGNTYRTVVYTTTMTEYQRYTHIAYLQLPEIQQRVVFERYLGPYQGRHYLDQWCKKVNVKGRYFRDQLTKAHEAIEADIAKLASDMEKVI